MDKLALARATAEAMTRDDRCSAWLGMRLEEVRPGYARVSMAVGENMVNGHDLCHGGMIFTLADTTFAYACNSHNQRAVAAGCAIEFLAPAHLGDVLSAEGVEVAHIGRSGVYDMKVTNQHGQLIALFRGKAGDDKRQARRGGSMTAFALEAVEKAPLADLRRLQLQRLQWSLQHAYDHVPHYRQKFDQAGVSPQHCRTLADLAKFPFTTKADLRETYPFGMFAVPMDKIVRIHASSGTTGKPTVVGYTAKDIDTWTNLMARSIRAAGAKPGEKVHVAYGYGLFTGGLGAHYGAERLGLAVIPLGGGMTERQVQLIQDFKPEIIMVTPSYMLAIADEMERQGMDPKQCSLRVGIFGAEPWTNEMRKSIEERLGLDAIDIYGLSEVMGPGVAQECIETKDGLTIWEDHFYPEIIDPESGKSLPDGEKGELVFTTLTKEGLPVIRYRTRDLTRLLPGSARTMRRMEKITGRSDDMLIIRGVNVFPSQIEEMILKQPELSPHYVLELSKDGPMDHLTVLVELAPGGTDAGSAEKLKHNIKSFIGVTTDVRIVPISSIERSIGKAKRVVDKRPK